MKIYNTYTNKLYYLIFFIYIFFSTIAYANTGQISKINISGNDRISEDTIKIFSEVAVGDSISNTKLNNILKNL